MKKLIIITLGLCSGLLSNAQGPAVTAWLQNTTTTGSHYVSGNSTLIQDTDLVNVQLVQYTAANVFISTEGIPAYPTGPFLDNNPSLATAQDKVYRIPMTPIQNTGTPTNTNGGNIGIFINGVSLFDYRDGVSYNFNAGEDQGGPGGGMGDGVWNRDAVPSRKRWV